MPPRRSPAVSLACITFLHGVNHSYSIVLSPLNSELQRFFGVADVSAVTSFKTTYLAVYAASNLAFGFLTNRFSARRMLAFGAALNAAAVASFALVDRDGLGWMHVLWAAAAVGGGAYHPVANVLVTRLYPDRKGWALGITGTGASAGFAFGPALAGILSGLLGFTWQGVAASIAALGFAASAAALFLVEDLPPYPVVSGREAEPRGGTGRSRSPGRAFLVLFLALLVLAAGLREVSTWSVMDLSDFYLEKAFGENLQTSWFLAFMFAPGIILQPLAGMFSDRSDRRKTAVGALALHALGTALIGLVPRGLLFVHFLLVGAGQAASVPTIEAIAADSSTPRTRGMVFGWLVTAGLGLGALGPLFSGMLVDGMGRTPFAYRTLFLLLSVVTLAGAAGLSLSRLVPRRSTLEEKGGSPA